MSEYGYIPEAPEQSFGNNKGIFNPKDIYDLTRADKYTNYGQLELIETKTHSSDVSDIDFTSIDESTYNVHLLTFNNVQSSGSGPQLKVRLFESGVKETASVYQNAIQFGGANGSFSEAKSTGDTGMPVNGNFQSGVSNGYIYFYNLGDSSKYSFLTSHSHQIDPTNTFYMGFGSQVMTQSSTVDGINLYNSNAGNFTDFDISLYGIKEYS
jgi:hypothetical protein